MKKIILIILFLVTISQKAQNIACSKTKILGSWNYLSSFSNERTINVDSIKKNYTDSTKVKGVCNFNSNGTYATISYIKNEKNEGMYKINENACIIVFGKKKRPPYYKIWRIIYVDEANLLLEQQTPKAPICHFYVKTNNG